MPTLDVLTGLSVADQIDFSVKQAQFKLFKQTVPSCAPTKRPEILENMNIYDAKGGHLESTEITLTYRGRFLACRCKRLPYVLRDMQRHLHDYGWPLRLMDDYLALRGPPYGLPST